MSKRVDNQYKMALISILILAMFSVGYYMFMKYSTDKAGTANTENTENGENGENGENAESTEKKEVINVFSNKKDSISQIDIIASNYTLVLQKKDNKFQWEKNKEADLDPVVINSLLDTLTTFNASKLIGENLKNLSDFGLAIPKYSIVNKLVDGTSKTVEIGDALPMDRGYYVKIKGGTKVYKIEKSIGDYLILDSQKIRNKKLVAFAKDDITLVSLTRKSKVAYEASRTDAKSSWTLKKPYEFKADNTKIDEIVGMVLDFSIKEFTSVKKSNLDEYGLESPSNSIKISTKDGKSVRIFLGMNKEGVGRYVKKEGFDEVFLLDQTEAGFTGYDFKDVANKLMDPMVQTEITTLEVTAGDEKLSLRVDPGKNPDINDDTVFLNNVQLKEKEIFNTFISGLNGTAASNIDPSAKPGSKQSLIVSAKIKDNKLKTSFVKKSDKEYYVLKNDKYLGYIISDTDYSKIKQAVDKLKVAK